MEDKKDGNISKMARELVEKVRHMQDKYKGKSSNHQTEAEPKKNPENS